MSGLSDLGIEKYELDVTDANAITRLRSILVELLGGKLDILVNNAYVLVLALYFILTRLNYSGVCTCTCC